MTGRLGGREARDADQARARLAALLDRGRGVPDPGDDEPAGWVPPAEPDPEDASDDPWPGPERRPGPAGRRHRGAERAADAAPVVLRRLAVAPRAVVVVVAVALLVLAGALLRATTAADGVDLVPVSDTTPAATTGPPAVVETAGSSGAPTPTAGQVVVHVVGRVARPGIVRLPAGSRVVDAVAAAGGVRAGADLARINLARPLVDGEQVRVPAQGEPDPPGGMLPDPSAPGPSGTGGPVDLNAADTAALDALPGVGPVLAGRILAWRTANGRFTSVDELGEVAGIGDTLLENLRPLVRVG